MTNKKSFLQAAQYVAPACDVLVAESLCDILQSSISGGTPDAWGQGTENWFES